MSEPAPKPPPPAAPKKGEEDDRLYGGFYEHSTAGSMPPAPFPAKGKPAAPAKPAAGGSALTRFFRALFGR